MHPPLQRPPGQQAGDQERQVQAVRADFIKPQPEGPKILGNLTHSFPVALTDVKVFCFVFLKPTHNLKFNALSLKTCSSFPHYQSHLNFTSFPINSPQRATGRSQYSREEELGRMKLMFLKT